MDRKSVSGIITLVIAALALAGYFNIKPVGPWVRKFFFDAAYYSNKAIAPPASRASGNSGVAQGCRSNLHRIESAKAKLRTTRAIGNVSWAEVRKEMGVRAMPKCPGGGEYQLGNQSISVRCTIGDNGTPARGDDHVYR